MRGNRRGQTTAEYALLVAVIIAALLVMQIYMKHGVSGRLKEATDQVGEQFTPRTATYNVSKGYEGKRSETTTAAGASTSTIDTAKPEKQTRKGSESPAQTNITTETLF